MSFAALLTLGVLAPAPASGHGYPMLRASNTTVEEGDAPYSTTAWVKISLSYRTNHGLSVGWYTHQGTAKPFSDYKPASGRAYIPRFHKATWVHVHVIGDKTVEPDEFFFVKLVNPRGAGLGYHAKAIVRIDNDDAAPLPPPPPPEKPWLEVHGDIVSETAGYADVVVELHSKAPHPPVHFTYWTRNGWSYPATGGWACTGTTPPDYRAQVHQHGVLSMFAGDQVHLQVPVCDDQTDEFDETFSVFVAPDEPGMVRVEKDHGHVVILDNDNPPTVSITAAPTPPATGTTIVEGQSVTFTVTVTGSTEKPVTVGWKVTGAPVGEAVLADLSTPTGLLQPLVFQARQTAREIVITAAVDGPDPSDEVFKVALDQATTVNATVAPAPADSVTMTIPKNP